MKVPIIGANCTIRGYLADRLINNRINETGFVLFPALQHQNVVLFADYLIIIPTIYSFAIMF